MNANRATRVRKMTDADVIVIGAGPAGCAAAYDLARSGMTVLILDRKVFPRLKPCGGALTVKAVKRLRYSIAPVIKFVARDLDVSLRRERTRRFESRHPIAVMTERMEFDAFCLGAAISSGGKFKLIEDIEDIGESDSEVEIGLEGGEILRARYAIGADGANSRTRRLLAPKAPTQALALEARIRPKHSARFSMRFDFDSVPGGYGWIFPKGDHLNVGLYSQEREQRITKTDLSAYIAHAVGDAEVDQMVGFPLCVGARRPLLTNSRVFLVGDAAGLAEPLLGEGIHKPGPLPPADNQKLAHDIFKEIIEVHSVHAVGTKGVADILVRYLKAGGFTDADIHVLPEEKYPNQVNVVVRLKGKGKGKPILWNGHMDVVEAKPKDWSLPPFQFIEKDGYFTVAARPT
jgi:geranylgeranyl reductase family protein